MVIELLFSKTLTKTDIEKRLSVPTVKKKCFLNFRGQHNVEFTVIDNKGKAWPFGCSIRKKKSYPKPVLSKGWLQFVRCWKLAIGDEVKLYRKQDKAGKEQNRIEVIKRATQRSSVLSPLVQNQDADRTMAIASYNNVEEEPTITSHSSDQAITNDQTDRVGLKFEFISLKPHIKVREPKFIDFFELGSEERRQKEHQSFLTLYHMVESPVTSSTAPYFKFF